MRARTYGRVAFTLAANPILERTDTLCSTVRTSLDTFVAGSSISSETPTGVRNYAR